MTDPYGNGVTFTYTTPPARGSNDPVILYIGGSTAQTVQYYVQQSVTSQVVSTMGTFNASFSNPSLLSFTWLTLGAYPESGQTIIAQITGFNHTFTFDYNGVPSSNSTFAYQRYFLSGYQDVESIYSPSTFGTCTSPITYQFSYLGQTGTVPNLTTTLPDSTSNQFDYWGYYSTAPGTGSSVVPYVAATDSAVRIYPSYVVDASGSPGSSGHQFNGCYAFNGCRRNLKPN